MYIKKNIHIGIYIYIYVYSRIGTCTQFYPILKISLLSYIIYIYIL